MPYKDAASQEAQASQKRRSKRYYRRHRTRLIKKSRQYRIKNHRDILVRRRKWAKENPDKVREANKKHRQLVGKKEYLCKRHGRYLQSPEKHKSGQGCRECGKETVSRARLSPIETAERHSELIRGQKWLGTHAKYWYECKKHGKYLQNFYSHNAGQGCPVCSESRGEKEISKILESLRISFLREFRIPECRDRHTLPFDFAMWIKRRLCLIEFQGIQHYKQVGFFGDKKAFKLLRQHDRAKRQFCKNNKIPLLIVKYMEKDIETRIFSFLTQQGAQNAATYQHKRRSSQNDFSKGRRARAHVRTK